MKVCINGQGHMTNDGCHGYKQQKHLNIFFFRTRRPMILKLGMKHQAMELCKVYKIVTLGWMTLTFLQQCQLRSPMQLTWKNRKMSFNGRKFARNEQIERRFMFMKIFWAQVVVYPCPRAIHVYNQNIQSSFGNPLANQSQTLC